MFLSLAREAREMCVLRMLLRHTAVEYLERAARHLFLALLDTGLLTP